MENYDIGDLITIETENTTYTGTIMPSLNDKIIVIKMKSGYNAGIDKNKIKSLKLINKGEKPNYKIPPLKISENNNLKNISILSTGGTVASRVDYNTGAVHPAFTADDLIRAVPELLDIANIRGKVVLNILSENMTPTYWKMIAEEIEKEVKNGADGIVIAHGTDTMHYTACALSFMVNSDIPIILVGAQRSSDRPSSDAALNLISATTCATEQIKGVFVIMHGESGDTVCHLHKGVKVRKSHSTRRDAFKSINSVPVAEINPFKKQIKYLTELEKTNKINKNNIKDKICIIRGVAVMIDRDLAELYQVETRRINEQVKRNIERFPEDFMFQLTKDELEIWKSQNATSNSIKMGLRKMPLAFTEQGVYMLSAVLKSKVATEVSLSIMRTFIQLKNQSVPYFDIIKRLEKLEVDSKETKELLDKVVQVVTAMQEIQEEAKENTKQIGFRPFEK